MRTIKLEVELIYDDELMHGNDKAAIAWFEHYLKSEKNTLFNAEVGDDVGEIKITKFNGVANGL
ncbi:hypothetical protein N9878_01000 [bacterium]|nr:hypothetical protein [bacterium]